MQYTYVLTFSIWRAESTGMWRHFANGEYAFESEELAIRQAEALVHQAKEQSFTFLGVVVERLILRELQTLPPLDPEASIGSEAPSFGQSRQVWYYSGETE